MATQNKTGVMVIVDKVASIDGQKSPNHEHGRTCYWQQKILERNREESDRTTSYEFQYISLSDSVDNGENPIGQVFDYENTKIVIISWDTINGDLIYGADKALNLMKHYAKDMDIWVKDGGVIIVECQEGGWRLTKEAYDLFTEDSKYPIHIKNEQDHHDRIHINKGLKNHPVLKGLKVDYEPSQEIIDKRCPLYPDVKSTTRLKRSAVDNTWTEKIFLGWFDRNKTHNAWIPLMFANSNETRRKDPIMLCRVVSNEQGAYGAFVVTTMFIAYSGWSQLIDNILNFRGTAVKQAHALSQSKMDIQKKEDFIILASALLELGLLGGGIWALIFMRDLGIFDVSISAAFAANGVYLLTKRDRIFQIKNAINLVGTIFTKFARQPRR